MSRRRQDEHRDRLMAYKQERGCCDCGTREGVLHFDHRPGTEKVAGISDLVGCSWERIMAEVAKCDVRCISCHARRHGVEDHGPKISAAATERILTARELRRAGWSNTEIAAHLGVGYSRVTKWLGRVRSSRLGLPYIPRRDTN